MRLGQRMGVLRTPVNCEALIPKRKRIAGELIRTPAHSWRGISERVSHASVTVDEKIVGQIGQGLLVLLGVGQNDSEAQVKILADKIVYLRIFGDEGGKMNRSL